MTTHLQHKLKKVAIIFLVETTKLGGAERRFIVLVDFWLRHGLDVTLYCSYSLYEAAISMGVKISKEKLRLINYEGVVGLPYFIRKISLMMLLGKIFYELRVQQFNQVHLSMNPSIVTFLYALVSKWLPPYSFSIVDSGIQSRPWMQKLYLVASSKNAVAIDCLSEAIRNSANEILRKYCLIQRYKDSESVLQFAPCSFLASTTSTSNSSLLSRPSYSANSHRDIDLLFLGRFVPDKGLEILEEAISIVRRNYRQNIEIHICGAGHLKFNIPNAQIYWAEDSISIMLRSKIFVSIQLVNNYPSQSLMEAMKCGCAIIATDVGETRKLVDDSSALLIPPNSTSLANAIITLLKDPVYCNTIAKAAQVKVRDVQSIERFSEYFLKKILKLSY
jgi:glycosyltransferase involved in cell wall biosynthesis